MPFVEIRGSVYFLEFGLSAQYRLDVLGLSVKDIFDTLWPRLPDGTLDPNPPQAPGKIKAILDLFAACTAHNFVQTHQPVRTSDEWAALIPMHQWKECCAALNEAIVKAPQVMTPSPASPAGTATGPGGQVQ